jgi:S1-C subfamily serine protease
VLTVLAITLAVLVGFFGAVIVRNVGSSFSRSDAAPPTVSRSLTPPLTDAPPAAGLIPDRESPPTAGGTAPTTPATPTPNNLVTGVVNITSTLGFQRAEASGTGIVLSADGQILTNNHVIKGATAIDVEVISTGKTYTAAVVGTSPNSDIAVLKLSGASGLPTARTGTATGVAVGDPVTAVGNAGGRGSPTFSSGSVVALGQTITASDSNGSNAQTLENLIQVNAQLLPGDSGGPLYAASGDIIGIDTAASGSGFRASRTTGGEGFAIPIDDALAVAHQITSGQASSTVVIGTPGFLGISTSTSPSVSGAVVNQVVSGSPAAKAGLGAGDVITAIDGQNINSATALATTLSAHKAHDTVSIKWTASDGTSHQANAELAAGPSN